MRMVFSIALAVLALLVLAGSLAPAELSALMQSALGASISYGGWFYLLVVFFIVAFLLYLGFSRFGKLRIGGEDAMPEFSAPTWFAMLFSAGMGIGLVFWGAAEPIAHVAEPPPGIEPLSHAAARAALRYSFFHWGLHPWAIYAVLGLAIAWVKFNRGRRGLISELLRPLCGRWVDGWLGRLVDILAIIATAIGVSPRSASVRCRSAPASNTCSDCRRTPRRASASSRGRWCCTCCPRPPACIGASSGCPTSTWCSPSHCCSPCSCSGQRASSSMPSPTRSGSTSTTCRR
jgi:hypothetical protein